MGKSIYKLSPNELQVGEAFIMLPWDFKILYGITCDTIRLPFMSDSPKKGYLMFFAIIQCSCLAYAGFFEIQSWLNVTYIFFTCSLCGAFMDVVIDGLVCILQRNDPINGA